MSLALKNVGALNTVKDACPQQHISMLQTSVCNSISIRRHSPARRALQQLTSKSSCCLPGTEMPGFGVGALAVIHMIHCCCRASACCRSMVQRLTLLVVPEQMASGLWKRRPRLTSTRTPLPPMLPRPMSPTCTQHTHQIKVPLRCT